MPQRDALVAPGGEVIGVRAVPNFPKLLLEYNLLVGVPLVKAALPFAVSLIAGLGCVSAQPPDRGVHIVEPIVVQRRIALVIGNQAYEQSPLRNPVNDASAMAQALRDLKFDEVTEKHDLTIRQMRAEIDRMATGLHPGDLALFYYAGHGIQANEQNYLIPIDFTGSEADLPYDAYPAAQARDKLEQSGARLRILILDACRNNPFRGKRDGTRGLSAMGSSVEGTYIAYSTADNGVAEDNPSGSNGLFTKELLAALRTPGLELKEIFEKTKEDVYAASHQAQRPFTYDGVIGRFYFNLAIAGSAGSGAGASDRAALTGAFNKGLEALGAKQYPVAIAELLRASRIDAKQFAVWANLGAAYAGAGEDASAESAYRQAVALKGDDAATHNNLALLLARDQRLTEAQMELDTAARLDPQKAAQYHYNMGALLANLKMLEAGGVEFRKSTEANPKFGPAQYQYGLYLVTKATVADGKIAAAPGTREAFEKYLEAKPDEQSAGIARSMLQLLGSPLATSWTRPAYTRSAGPPGRTRTITVDGKVIEAKMIRKTVPEYSPLAKAARLQGTVALNVVIGRDGAIASVELISGHPFLVKAAIDAVKDWVYSPTLLNGEPVDVVTKLVVVFRLD